jgi:enoyl-CoA hydratase
MQPKEILFETLKGQYGDIGLITLNRPKALNALTENMCIQMYQQLKAWADMSNVKAVVVQGAGDKAFCAGGDIRTIYENRNNISASMKFFEHEYRLDTYIYHYPKPYIAIMDGIAMGGGLGISALAKYRIATERSIFAMPETAIGFFPDVGGCYFLPRLTEKMGWYLALTGNVVDVSDAIYAGLVDAQIKSSAVEEFIGKLINIDFTREEEIQSLLSVCQVSSLQSKMSKIKEMINQCFSAESVEKVLLNLQNHPDDEAKNIYNLLLSRSPMSLKVTWEAMMRGQKMDFDACIAMDHNVSYQFLKRDDFYEGVRAAVIDKDKKPKWNPALLSDVSELDVSVYFQESVK